MLRRLLLTLYLSTLALVAYNQARNLEFYQNQGIKNSPLLNDYRNQISSAVTDSLLIRAAKKPLIDAKSQLLYSPAYHNFGYDEVVTDGGNYTAVVGVSQNFFNRKELANKYNAAGLQKQLVSNSSMIS